MGLAPLQHFLIKFLEARSRRLKRTGLQDPLATQLAQGLPQLGILGQLLHRPGQRVDVERLASAERCSTTSCAMLPAVDRMVGKPSPIAST